MYERNGNDSTMVEYSVEGYVVYFKSDYGFIKPIDMHFDDLFFHVRDVEPWREGYIEFKGRGREKRMKDENGKEILIPYYAGEHVKFDIKDNNKQITNKITGVKKKGYRAVNIEILSEYKPTILTEK